MPLSAIDFRKVRAAHRFSAISPFAGKHLFVQSTHAAAGTGGNYGLSPDAPLTTIDEAIALCTASAGDVIHVGPGHVETVVAAAGVAVDVAGVTIVGYGTGHTRPKVNFTTLVGASFDISAASCTVENIWFNCAIDDQTAMVNITAADVTIRGCEFTLADATYDADIGILVGANGDRFTIEDCYMYGDANTTVVAGAISFGAADNSVIRRNRILGYFGTTGNILNAAAAVNVAIHDNVLLNRSADGNNLCVNLHASTVALVARNSMSVIDSAGPMPVVAAAGFVAGNYFSAAVSTTASTLL